MGTIREYAKQDGSTTYHAEIRLKGHPPKRTSFPTRLLAEEWIAAAERSCFPKSCAPPLRHDWTLCELTDLFNKPFPRLIARAMEIHAQAHDPTQVQCCQLISIKTGGCSEDCAYCAQSSKYATQVTAPSPKGEGF